jgi:hypothetical protein
MSVSDGVITARVATPGTTGVMSVSGRFSLVNGIATLLPASTGESGIASFDSQFFSVSSTGHVTLNGDLGGSTGDTVLAGVAIGVANEGGNVRRINNIGVTSFNGLTGAVTLTGDGAAIFGAANNTIGARLATINATGVASFNSNFFDVTDGAVALKSPYSVIGVTGIAVGSSDVGLSGTVTITAGTNISIDRAGNTITINSSAVGGGSGITANLQQVLFSSGNGGTGSNNFVFNGLAATFGGANTQFTITGPTFTIGDNTVVRGGVFYDAAESAPYQDAGNFAVNIRGANGSVQRIRIAPSNPYTISMDSVGWTNALGVAESVVVILQCANSETGQFASDILTQDPRPILGGVTGGVDVFTLMRIKTDATDPVRMAFPIARGMTAPNFTIGTQ